MKRFSPRTLALAVLALAVALWFSTRRDGDRPAAFTEAAVREHAGSSLFFNRSARELAEAAAPKAAGRAGADAARFDAAAGDPRLFRQLDRKHRFDTVLLAGDPAWSAALTSHLAQSSDWMLQYVDPSVLVFRRPSREPWAPSQLDRLREQLEPLGGEARAVALAATASRLQALGKPDLARQETERALGADPDSAAAWDQMARYHAQFKNWRKSLEAAQRALRSDPDFASALMTMANVLVASGRMHEAYPVSRRLRDLAPDDAYVLFLHAKVAHGVRAFGDEIKTLTRLISIVEKAGRPVAAYRIYLAQAHAAAGNGEPAVEAFQQAIDSGELTPEQRDFAAESIARIRPRIQL